jgi:hypothetical protein
MRRVPSGWACDFNVTIKLLDKVLLVLEGLD